MKDKITDKVEGKAKEMAGRVTGNKRLETEGRAQDAVGGAKGKVEEATSELRRGSHDDGFTKRDR